MKRAALALALVLALVTTAWAMNARYSSGTAGISVTQANTNTAFTDNHSGGTSAAFNARYVSVCSRSTSANSCFVDLGDGVATTADWRLAPGACIQASYSSQFTGGEGWAAIGSICAAGETATFDIMAGR
jgi:hypothetical protein